MNNALIKFFTRFKGDLSDLGRWQGKTVIKSESVAEHSFDVILFTRLLFAELFHDTSFEKNNFNQVITYAIFHDVDELITGDIRHDVKYGDNGKELRELLDTFIKNKIVLSFSDKSQSSNIVLAYMLHADDICKSIVKVADWMSMSKYCFKETELGNSTFNDTLSYCLAKLHESFLRMVVLLNDEDIAYDQNFVKDFSSYLFNLLKTKQNG